MAELLLLVSHSGNYGLEYPECIGECTNHHADPKGPNLPDYRSRDQAACPLKHSLDPETVEAKLPEAVLLHDHRLDVLRRVVCDVKKHKAE